MLTVSRFAAAQLDAMLRKTSHEEDAVIRVVRNKHRFRLQVDLVHGGDVVFAYHGRALLVLDDWVSRLLAAGNLDVHEVDGKSRLTLTRRGERPQSLAHG